MLSAEAVQKIADLGVHADGATFHEEHGINHLVHQGKITPLLEPLVGPIAVRTLAAVVDFLDANRDDLNREDLTIVVVGPGRVEIVGKAREDGRRQTHLIATEPDVAAGFGGFCGKYMPIEDFIVGAQQRFRAGGHITEMLAVVGNISQNDVRQVADDGTTQDVTVKAGVVKVATVALPNPVLLIPRRSFPEVTLEPVPFVLRVKRGEQLPLVALFEGDGGAWAVDATKKIADWLRDTWVKTNGGVVDDIPFGILA